MDRKICIDAIRKQLDGRPLAAIGTRGSDFASLIEIFDSEFEDVFSITDPIPNFGESLEDLTFRRRDTGSLGNNPRFKAEETVFTKRIEERLRNLDPLILTYRPEKFIESLVLRSNGTVLGNDTHTFARFNHKPTVERDLKALGILTIPWKVVSDSNQVTEYLENHEAVVVRPQSGADGEGIKLFSAGAYSPDDRNMILSMIGEKEALISIAPYFGNSISLSMSGVVYQAGTSRNSPSRVSTFPLAAQLIGVPSLVDATFGHCGNDFALPKTFPPEIYAECSAMTKAVGHYLSSKGYVGAFGIDMLLSDDQIYFMEINPRLTAVSRLLKIAVGDDQADILLEHLAATLGVHGSKGHASNDWQEAVTPCSQMILHNQSPIELICSEGADQVDLQDGPTFISEMVPRPLVRVEPGAVTERIIMPGQITLDGREITGAAQACVDIRRGLYVPFQPELARPDFKALQLHRSGLS